MENRNEVLAARNPLDTFKMKTINDHSTAVSYRMEALNHPGQEGQEGKEGQAV